MSGYGQSGPYRGYGGYATIAEAFSGLASFTGFPETGPAVSPLLGDYLVGAFGALAALRAREQSGRGQVVDVSLFEPFLRLVELGLKEKALGRAAHPSRPIGLMVDWVKSSPGRRGST